jgi:PBP1b-binding outer membrane lipoprotein LpoB
MKKILSLVLILAMVLGMLAACGEEPTNPTKPGASLEDAKAYLAAFYKEDEGTIARRDFSLIAVVMIDGVSFPITWTTDSPDYVTLGAVENNTVKVDIVEEPAEEVTFKLTGTLTDAEGNTASVTVTRIIEAKEVTGVEFVAAPVAGTAYKFAV